MIKLSIIIPVFNVENYLEKCLHSILNQIKVRKDKDVELIVLNDGSTDSSGLILSKFKNQYPQMVLINQENKGLGATRNIGITLAKGEYIWFIDSDDFISTNSLDKLMDSLLEYNSDILAFDFQCTNQEGAVINWIEFKLNFNGKEVLNGEEFYYNNYSHSYIWLYLFRKSLFKDLYFLERANMQDSEIMPKILSRAKTIRFIDHKVYNYVNRENSFINSNQKKIRINYYRSIIKVYISLDSYKETLEDSPLKLGINLKLQEINKILFQQFLYSNFSISDIRLLLRDLKNANLFPFHSFTENSYKKIVYFALRRLINKKPIQTYQLFSAIHQRVPR